LLDENIMINTNLPPQGIRTFAPTSITSGQTDQAPPDLSNEAGLAQHLATMDPADRHVPMWVHPSVAPHLMQAFGASGAVIPHPGTAMGGGGFQIGGARPNWGVSTGAINWNAVNQASHPGKGLQNAQGPQGVMQRAQAGATSSGTIGTGGGGPQGPPDAFGSPYDNSIEPDPLNQGPGAVNQPHPAITPDPSVQVVTGSSVDANGMPFINGYQYDQAGYPIAQAANSGGGWNTQGWGSGSTMNDTSANGFGAAGFGASGVGTPGPAGSAVMAAHYARQS
jgi:hypothetical protein